MMEMTETMTTKTIATISDIVGVVVVEGRWIYIRVERRGDAEVGSVSEMIDECRG